MKVTRLAVTALVLCFALSCSDSGREPILTLDSVDSDTVAGDILESDLSLEETASQDLTTDVTEGDETSFDVTPEDVPVVDLTDTTEIYLPPDVTEIEDTLPDDEWADLSDVVPEVVPDVIPDEYEIPEVLDSCAALVECGDYLQCSDETPGCWQNCVEHATPEALTAVSAIRDCLDTLCAGLQDAEFNVCMWQHCQGPVRECLDVLSDENCSSTMECITGCQESETLCQWECMAQADPDALDMILDFMLGLVPETESFAMLVQCMGGQGTATCYETTTCMNGCMEDWVCLTQCLKQTDPEAQALLLSSAGCEGSACIGAMVGCVGGNGTDSCGEAVNCIMSCQPSAPDTCMTNCTAATSPEGAEDLQATFECVLEQCGTLEGDLCPAAYSCISLCPGISV